MFKPTFEEFDKLCTQGNIVPVYQEHLADMQTPVSVANHFVEDENVFLLESVEGGERWGRYSFIGINPTSLFIVEDDIPYSIKDGLKTELDNSEGPLFALRQVLKGHTPVEMPNFPRFSGGAVGFLSFETANEFEKLPIPQTKIKGPKSFFMITDEMIVFDNIRHTGRVLVNARTDDFATTREAYDNACERINVIEKRISDPVQKVEHSGEDPEVNFTSNLTQEEFTEMVGKAKNYIVEGDIIQVVLSQRFTTDLPAPPFHVYRALRLINPSPYTFFFKYGDRALIGSSPEIMVRLKGKKAVVRPIAGTRPRGATPEEDIKNGEELLADKKEIAEHVMLVDLGRNDLGHVAKPATVEVKDLMILERYSHVMHIVSNVECEVVDGMDAFDLIKATFPAGTLSGAPKIRAMEIINELESQARGPYGGAIGHIGYDGDMDLAITIRTLEIDGDKIAVQAGAGIVADSDPIKEFEETQHKSRGMKVALELAARDLKFKA